MRQTCFYGVLMAFTLLLAGNALAQQPGSANGIYIHVYDMQADGDSVYVDFDIILKEYRISSSYQVLFTPVVSDMSGSGAIAELPAILIEGKTRGRLNRRLVSLKGHDVVEGELYDLFAFVRK